MHLKIIKKNQGRIDDFNMLNFKFFSFKMGILSFIYISLILISNALLANDGINNSLFDFIASPNGGGSFSLSILILGILPVLVLIFPVIIDRIDSDMVIIRIKHKRKLVNNHFFFAFIISLIIVGILVLIGIVASLIHTGHLSNLWGTKNGSIYFYLEDKQYFPLYIPYVTTFKVWMYLILSRILAIYFMSSCIIFFKSILSKNIYVLFITFLLLATDSLFSIFTNRFSFFIEVVRIKMDTWLSPEDQLFSILYLLTGIIIFYLLSIKMYSKKEFY